MAIERWRTSSSKRQCREHPPRRARHRRGFTLIEAIVAMVILAISVPALLWSMRAAHVQRVSPVQASQARWLAAEKLEDIIADRHSTTRGYHYVLNGNYPAEFSIVGFPGFTRSVSIVETAADLTSPGTGYKKVTVHVGWIDAAGSSRTLSVSTVVTDYDAP